MCDVCGCGDRRKVSIDVHASLLAGNDREAAHLREHFVRAGVLAVNVMGSPGAGKTALLEATAKALSGRLKLAAVSGDLATELDAERLERAGVPSATITTGSACHLDATMVHDALHDGALSKALAACDLFFIENVGNLVCPALFDLGERAKVVVMSITEGADKPLKYPHVFRAADLLVLTKCDLAPHLDFDQEQCAAYARSINPGLAIVRVSARTGEGVDAWSRWVRVISGAEFVPSA